MTERQYWPERLFRSQEDLEEVEARLRRLRYYHRLVPKGWKENIEYRKRVIRWACGKPDRQRAVWKACSQDPLYFINVLGVTYDPRPPYAEHPIIPFITFEWQDDFIVALIWAIESGRSIRIEKSRGVGLSWLISVVYEWLWHFRPMQTFRLLSQKQELVDKTGDMKSLFQKIDFFHQYMPQWMVPRRLRNLLHLQNMDNGSAIEGESTTVCSARGGRYTSVFVDEAAFVPNLVEVVSSLRSASECKIFGSTANGDTNLFYDMKSNPQLLHMRIHWSMHPAYRRGLYRDALGKLRSPWYDKECLDALHPHEIPQELDIDYNVNASTFFRSDVLEKVRSEWVVPEFVRGHLLHRNAVPGEFAEDPMGEMKLWFHPAADGRPPPRKYVVGADVATGAMGSDRASASNSCLAVIDAQTAEKCAEYVTPLLMPHEFAAMAVSVCRWFANADGTPARLIWESQGPGQIFGRTVNDLGHTNVYMRKDLESNRPIPQDKPGFYISKNSKREILDDLARAWKESSYAERSLETVQEARQFVFFPNGGVGHTAEASDTDPSGLGPNHGDRVMATALAWHEAKAGVKQVREAPPDPPRGSLAYILLEKKRGEEKNSVWFRRGSRWSA